MAFAKNLLIVLLTLSVHSVMGTPVPEEETGLAKRGAVLSGQWDTESVLNGRFLLENNLWGMSSATSGSQSSQVTSTNGNSVSWYTNYNWAGGNYNVKSYANLDLRVGLGKRISAISSIPTSWSWTYSSASSGLVSNVSYDLWLSNTAGTGGASASSTYEIMIWLSTRGGAGPAGSQIGTVNINGVNWRLFKGNVASWVVFSFVAPNEITNYNSDLKPFLTYLTSNQGISSSQYVVQAQAGTEPFIGSARLTTNSYSISIN
ncbi:glycoside hydrolase family 12 protein [Collybia nuda]|uniref:Glycoside hydrolase family 12 protein n=1 Tax=Collybia nuda TaxID=64659 RepID=A0A9P5Y5A8_9AGAR|nr:glycoside hydrolase family 12 protein [Collybia nuda]